MRGRQRALWVSAMHMQKVQRLQKQIQTAAPSLCLLPFSSSPTLSHFLSVLQAEGAPRHAAVINAKRKCSAKKNKKIKKERKKYIYYQIACSGTNECRTYVPQPNLWHAKAEQAEDVGHIHAYIHTYIYQTWPTRHFARGPRLWVCRTSWRGRVGLENDSQWPQFKCRHSNSSSDEVEFRTLSRRRSCH